MHIYYALSLGKWSVCYRADWPTFMRVGGKSIPDGEEEIQFTLDQKVIHTKNKTVRFGRYAVDSSAYQNHTGPIVLAITMDGEETIKWNIDKLLIHQIDEQAIECAEPWISYLT